MSDQTAPIKKCTCGKTGEAIDHCVICLEEKLKSVPFGDSMILASMKMALVEAFFRQQYYMPPGGGQGHYYGGISEQVLVDITKSEAWKKLQADFITLITDQKERWNQLFAQKFEQHLGETIKNLSSSWSTQDLLRDGVNQAGKEYAKELLSKDEAFQQKIREAVGGGDYSVNISVNVSITKKV